MNATACEDRGADLFLWARGGTPDGDLSGHVAACAGCRADLERLRALARDLPAASAGVVPLAATRAAVLSSTGTPSALPPRALPGPLLRIVAPLAALAASAGLLAFALSRGPGGPRVEAPEGAVEVAARWGGASLDGLLPGGLGAGAVLSARKTAAVRVGAPVAAEVVLGEGTRLRLAGAGGGRTLEILEGLAWFDPAPPDGTAADPALRTTLRVRAGDLEVDGRGARFTIERRASGAAVVYLEAGVAVLRAGGGETTASGPCRVDVPPGGRPGNALPAEPTDATGWFARPEVLLERDAAGRLVVTLRPEVPCTLRIAPWDRFEPVLALRAERPGRPPVVLPVKEGMILPPIPAGDRDGSFLLSGARSYKITLDVAALGLEPGAWSLSAVYTAHRVGGLWRGTRSSKPVELEVK